jgi:hypothetical protein
MSTLAEIEAAASSLPHEEQRSLLEWLSKRMPTSSTAPSSRHSLLDIPPISLGGIIRPPDADDDILGEMLEDRT